MVYHYDISRNRRLLLLPFISVVLLTVSLVIAVLWKPLIGILSLIPTVYLGYLFMKFFRNQMKSVIHVTDEGVHGISCDESKFSFRWENLSLAGEFSTPGDSCEIFLYSDNDDRLIRIPYLYSHFDDMILEIREQTSEFVRWEGLDGKELELRLKNRFTN